LKATGVGKSQADKFLKKIEIKGAFEKEKEEQKETRTTRNCPQLLKASPHILS